MRRAKEVTREVFKDHHFDVTVDQWIILKRISEEDGISQVDIANSTFKDPAAVTRMLDILSKKGLIARRPRIEDRRVFGIHFTEEGKLLVEKMTPLVQELRTFSFDGLSVEEMETFKKLVNKIYENIEAYKLVKKS